MDLFNRPPTIAEDTLRYTLYPPSDASDKSSVTTFAACIWTYIDTLLADFLWHRDAFELKVVSDPDSSGYILEGTMRVGDCVDDEWCTVWLLREISAKWDLAISVFDSDGEFLLIEAAESLPSWVKPSNSENRVWIYNSHLHLIDISHVSSPSRKRHRRVIPGSRNNDEEEESHIETDDEDFIAVEDAIKLLRDPSVDTLAPSKTEETVWNRISQYPNAARQHIHITNAYVPIDIAKTLSIQPALIQKAVEAFYTRDAIQLRAAHRMSRFPPGTSVLTSVKMTRPAYAQLMGQKFFPPKVFGRWQETEGTTEWRWRDIGMKIAVGFEMLYQESKPAADKVNTTVEGIKSSTDAKKDALRRTPEYVQYIQNLAQVGYFKGEIEGSQLWNILENKAATTFLEVRREDDATRPAFATLVNSAISQASDVHTAASTEDSDSWLDVDAENFDDMLEKTMGPNSRARNSSDAMVVDDNAGDTPESRLAAEQALRLQNLAEQVEEFVEGEGDLDGARFKDEDFSDEEFSDDPMSEDSDDEQQKAENPLARQAALDKLVPAIEASDYGKMPASYHSNSQKLAPATVETDVVSPAVETAASSTDVPPPSKPIRQPILPRDRYDGVDSDDETDEEGADEDSESEEDRPQVVGEIEVDMDEEEDEFLEFSRQALGISDEQWNEIIRDRKDRGAFVPISYLSAHKPLSKDKVPSPEQKTKRDSSSAPGPNDKNPDLDSFEAVMQAMDAELARNRSNTNKTVPPKTKQGGKDKGKGKAKENASVTVDDEEDIETAMDAELKAALERAGDDGDDDSDIGEEPMDYNLIKNFLESFKSQGGLSGPVSNLASRLQPDWKLPRDDS